VTIENVIPLYTSGSEGQSTENRPDHPAAAAQRPGKTSPHSSSGADQSQSSPLPPRPAGRRPDAPPQPQPATGGDGGSQQGTWGNTQVFMGFGLFPSLMGLHFNSLWGNAATPGHTPDTAPTPATAAEERQRQQAAMLMQMLALVITVFVLFY